MKQPWPLMNIANGEYHVVFCTGEMLLTNKQCRLAVFTLRDSEFCLWMRFTLSKHVELLCICVHYCY